MRVSSGDLANVERKEKDMISKRIFRGGLLRKRGLDVRQTRIMV